MVDTPNYGWTHADAGQNNKTVTYNTALDDISKALADAHDMDFTSGDVTLTTQEWHDHLIFRATNLSVEGRKVTIPASEARFALIDNVAGTVALEVVNGTTTVIVGRGLVMLIHTDGTTNDLTMAGDDSEPCEFNYVGAVPASTILYRKKAAQPFWLADDLAGSQGVAGTAPSGGAVAFDVDVDGTKIGEVSFADGVATPTFTTSGSTREKIDVGEVLTIESPGTVHSIADIAIALRARRG